MKKLIYLVLTVLIVACSSDDSSSSLTFFEKYDRVVWQESGTEYVYRIQYINGNTITVKYFEGYSGDEYCESETLSNSDLIEVTENSFRFNEQDDVDFWVTTVTAVNNGNNLIVEYSDEPEYSENYSRTGLNTACD
jgi:hypothetical protein